MSLFVKSKKIAMPLIASVLLSMGLSASAVACPDGEHKGSKHGMKSERMVSKLNMTPEQREEFRKVMKIQHEKRRSFMESQREETRTALSSVLTKEQLEAFDQYMEEKRGRMSKYRSKEGMGQGENRKFRFSE
jgi:Spy/CpxP family protein refolding chaperone